MTVISAVIIIIIMLNTATITLSVVALIRVRAASRRATAVHTVRMEIYRKLEQRLIEDQFLLLDAAAREQ